MFIKNF
jgi:hypothetical protein